MNNTFLLFYFAYLLTAECILLPIRKYVKSTTMYPSRQLVPSYVGRNNSFIDLLEIFRPGLLLVFGLNIKIYPYTKWIKFHSSLTSKQKIVMHAKLALITALFAVLTSYFKTEYINSFLLYYTLFITMLFIVSLFALITTKK